jgi:hypothetical protein
MGRTRTGFVWAKTRGGRVAVMEEPGKNKVRRGRGEAGVDYSSPLARHTLPPQLGASTSCAAICHVPSNVSLPTRCPEMKNVASPRVRSRCRKEIALAFR